MHRQALNPNALHPLHIRVQFILDRPQSSSMILGHGSTHSTHGITIDQSSQRLHASMPLTSREASQAYHLCQGLKVIRLRSHCGMCYVVEK